MKLTRKITALLICVLMLASALPMGVFAADELLVSDYDVYLPFDDATSYVNTYFAKRTEGSNFQFLGNQDTKGTYWSTYETEENGNKYLYQVNPTNQGYTFANVEGYDNFSKLFQLSFRMKLDSHSNTQTTGLYIPVIRGSIGTTASANTSGTGTANILAVANTATYPGEAAVEGEKNLIGYLIPGSGNSTTYNHTGYGIYSDTWYDIVFMADKATGKCWFSVTDGTNEYELAYDHGTLKGLSILNKVMLFRTYQTAQGAKVSLDDIRLTNVETNFVIKNNMSGLVYKTGTNEETGEPETYNYASTNFPVPGFAVTGANNANWELVTEENGNKYLSHLYGSNTKSPITMADSYDILDGGDFALSFDYKQGEGIPTSGVGMLSLKIDAKGATNEFRIINLGTGGGMYFGPATWEDFQIGTLTTPDSEGGAKWHNIKVVFRPYISEDYIDMNYEFYLDGELAAYTDIVHGSYNFYTKASGSWEVNAGLQPAKRVATAIASGDTNENGEVDEGEEVTYTYKWVGRDESLDIDCSWGTSPDNVGRLPMGYWDGYAQVEFDGSEEMLHQDGQIATLASIYMFHWNNAAFAIDNVEIDRLEADTDAIENVEIVGYQLGADGTSIRFIACVDSLNFGQVGMDLDVFAPEDDLAKTSTVLPLWATKVDNKMSNSIYTALTADGEQVGAMEAFGAHYFTMLSVYDIDSNATIRINPYTTKDEVRTYGAAKEYIVTFDGSKVSVKAPDTHTADYSDGFDTTGANNGYCYNAWASYTWDTLTDGVKADIGWGGESNTRTAALQDDGSIKINTDLNFKTTHKIQIDVPVLDEEGNPTYDEEGNPVTEKVDVKDNDGNQLYKSSSFSRRIKFANIIPANLEDYKGYTFVLTAKVKATQINDRIMKDVVVGEGEDAVTYNAAFDEEDPDGQCGISFGFMTDYKTYMVSCNQYVIKNDGEWMEIHAAVNVDDALLAHEYVAPKEADLAPVTDAEGVVHPAPLRPTINLQDNVDSGYAREIYVKDLTLTVVPTPGYVAAE